MNTDLYLNINAYHEEILDRTAPAQIAELNG